jgi:hypothetical protein
MSHSDSSDPLSSSLPPDYLPPPPRAVAPSLRARWMRVVFPAGMLLGPLLMLGIGELGSQKFRTLAAQGRSTTGQVMFRG